MKKRIEFLRKKLLISEDNIRLFLIFFFLYAITSFLYIAIKENPQIVLARFWFASVNAAFTSYITVIIIGFAGSKTQRILINLLTALLLMLNLIELFLLIKFKSLIFTSTIMLVMETNPTETSGFLSLYLTTFTIIWVIAYIIAAIIFIVYINKLCKRRTLPKYSDNVNKNANRSKVCISNRKCLNISFGICSLLIICAYIIDTYYIVNIRRTVPYMTLNPIERVILSTNSAIKEYSDFKNIIGSIRKSPPEAVIAKDTISNFIFVIGESLSKHHMSSYGYKNRTTPNIDSLAAVGEMTMLSDAITSKTITLESIKTMLTFCGTKHSDKWYDYHTLPEILKAAGYETAWISNQEKYGFASSTTTAIASYCDTLIFSSTKGTGEEQYGSFDENILPHLENILNHNGKYNRNAIFIHLIGSHHRYSTKYPQNFNQFTRNDIKYDIDLSNAQKDEITTYDNSVLYNDYIILQIIKRFNNKDALLIYLSDHGEELYEDGSTIGHNYTDPTNYMAEIPAMIWISPSLKAKRTGTAANESSDAFARAAAYPYASEYTIHTVLDLLNIQTKDLDTTKSLFHKAYDTLRQRYINDGVLYPLPI